MSTVSTFGNTMQWLSAVNKCRKWGWKNVLNYSTIVICLFMHAFFAMSTLLFICKNINLFITMNNLFPFTVPYFDTN